MEKFIVLYNPLSGKVNERNIRQEIGSSLNGLPTEFVDLTKIADIGAYVGKLQKTAGLLLVGGDGTLNRFLNDTDGINVKNIWYYAAGNGNDFWHDIGKKVGDAPICIDEYLKDLPSVTVKGKNYKFLNGVGYGIDGYCCEVGDKLKAEGKEVNYTAIAVKGLLFHYKPCAATVTVDGKTKRYQKVWIAPTMNGRYYGGGMMPTPAQNRLNEERTVSVCLMYGKGKLKTLTAFSSIFKGEHVKKTNMVEIKNGKKITVKFERPTAIQIDGETILGVTEYTVCSAALQTEAIAA